MTRAKDDRTAGERQLIMLDCAEPDSSLGRLAMDVIEDAESKKRGAKTIHRKRQVLDILRRDLGVSRAGDLATDDTIRCYRELIERRYASDTTRRLYVAEYNSIMRVLQALGRLEPPARPLPEAPKPSCPDWWARHGRSTGTLPADPEAVRAVLSYFRADGRRGRWRYDRSHAFFQPLALTDITIADALRLRKSNDTQESDVKLFVEWVWAAIRPRRGSERLYSCEDPGCPVTLTDIIDTALDRPGRGGRP
jgi:hypothetical protein